jgi:hypothetical protein
MRQELADLQQRLAGSIPALGAAGPQGVEGFEVDAMGFHQANGLHAQQVALLAVDDGLLIWKSVAFVGLRAQLGDYLPQFVAADQRIRQR